MITTKIENLTEEEFYSKFKLTKNHIDNNAAFGGCMFETYGEELDYVFEMSKKNCVITIIESDEEREETFFNSMAIEITEIISPIYYATGFHLVNRIGYFVLDKPYEYEFEVKVE